MLKGELSIIGVALVTCLVLFFKLQSPEDAVARPSSIIQNEQDEKTIEDSCKSNPCITFLGNIRVGDNLLLAKNDKSIIQKDKNHFFQSLKPLLSTSTAVIGNLDTPFLDKKPPASKANKTNLFWADQKSSSALKKANITAVSLANNHIYDFGDQGLASTARALESSGIRYFGTEKRDDTTSKDKTTSGTAGNDGDPASQPRRLPVFRQKVNNGPLEFEFAIINAMSAPPVRSQNNQWQMAKLDVNEISNRIADLKKESPQLYVIAYLGNAKVRGPATKQQQNDARALIDAGADLVIGYGSRFLQAVERYKGRWILYGLGDTVTTADMPIPIRNQQWPYSAALRLVLKKKGEVLEPYYQLYPILNDGTRTNFQPRLLDKKRFGELFWYLMKKETIEYDFKLKKKLHPRRESVGRYIALSRGAK